MLSSFVSSLKILYIIFNFLFCCCFYKTSFFDVIDVGDWIILLELVSSAALVSYYIFFFILYMSMSLINFLFNSFCKNVKLTILLAWCNFCEWAEFTPSRVLFNPPITLSIDNYYEAESDWSVSLSFFSTMESKVS